MNRAPWFVAVCMVLIVIASSAFNTVYGARHHQTVNVVIHTQPLS